MPRQFLTRSETDEHDAIIEAVAGRENELASYDANVDAYTQQLTAMDLALPATWIGLEQYQGKSAEQIFAIGGTSAIQLLAAKMNHRERVRMLLFTENVERTKSEAAYSFSKSQLPVDPIKLNAGLARYAAKVAAQRARA